MSHSFVVRFLTVELHGPVMRVLSKNPSVTNRCYKPGAVARPRGLWSERMVSTVVAVSPDGTAPCSDCGKNDSIRDENTTKLRRRPSFTRMANQGRGKRMRRSVTHLTLLAAAATLATGCVPIRHNLPPEQRLLEPGPGVGGPGPGVLAISRTKAHAVFRLLPRRTWRQLG